jgi:hypothetical protein
LKRGPCTAQPIEDARLLRVARARNDRPSKQRIIGAQRQLYIHAGVVT